MVEISVIVDKLTDDALALLVTGSVLYMAIRSITVPEFLIVAFGLIIGFYFKNK